MLKKLGYLFSSLILILVFTQRESQATRPHISMEEKARRTPILFLAVLSKQEEKVAPVRENVLYDSKTALDLKFSYVRYWKPKAFSWSLDVYTWTRQKSACPSVTFETGKRYIVFAEYDASHQFVLSDSCGAIIDATTPDGIELEKKLENLYR